MPGSLTVSRVGTLVSVSSFALLVMTWWISMLDARMQVRLSVANRALESANEELRQRALRDPLTGLPNRLLFEERLASALPRAVAPPMIPARSPTGAAPRCS